MGCRCRAFSIKTRGDATLNSHQVYVTCHPGLEDVLSAELKALGLDPEPNKAAQRGRLALRQKDVTDKDLFRCCLYLGGATSIQWKCASFSARGLAELRRKTANVDWSKHIIDPLVAGDGGNGGSPLAGRIAVRVSASKSKLFHSKAIEERIVLGIYDSFGHKNMEMSDSVGRLKDERPDPDRKRDCTLLLDANIDRDHVDIFVNAYPSALHQRGYRLQPAKAPLREDLAYAMLFVAGWLPAWIPNSSTSSQNVYPALLDPFCGSGTIVIEGLAMAMRIPPGRLRASPFQGTVVENPDLWDHLLDDATMAANSMRCTMISASDRDGGAVKATQANAERAGVWEYLKEHLHRCSLSGQPWFEDPVLCPDSVLMVTNPPFGNRIGKKDQILSLYQTLGNSLQKLNEKHGRNARGIILTDNPTFVQNVGGGRGLQSKTLIRMNHGGQKASVVEWKS